MKGFVYSIVLFLATTFYFSAVHAEEQPPGRCDVGPLTKTYGGASWLVYSCTTDKNVVLVSAPSSPAMPFVFCFCAKDGRYQLTGEGTGNKNVTLAAFGELKKLTESDISELILQTKKINARQPEPGSGATKN